MCGVETLGRASATGEARGREDGREVKGKVEVEGVHGRGLAWSLRTPWEYGGSRSEKHSGGMDGAKVRLSGVAILLGGTQVSINVHCHCGFKRRHTPSILGFPPLRPDPWLVLRAQLDSRRVLADDTSHFRRCACPGCWFFSSQSAMDLDFPTSSPLLPASRFVPPFPTRSSASHFLTLLPAPHLTVLVFLIPRLSSPPFTLSSFAHSPSFGRFRPASVTGTDSLSPLLAAWLAGHLLSLPKIPPHTTGILVSVRRRLWIGLWRVRCVWCSGFCLNGWTQQTVLYPDD
ncbi:hypothetical protein B0H11DRAFT_2043116 [Mycena galericulata]|nr:hypothetical protein B0H11DRAFT_2043116 [Mycena galericulata]